MTEQVVAGWNLSPVALRDRSRDALPRPTWEGPEPPELALAPQPAPDEIVQPAEDSAGTTALSDALQPLREAIEADAAEEEEEERAARRSMRARLLTRAAGALGGLLFLALFFVATGESYGLRVTSDAPTYLALVRQLAITPLAGASPYLAAAIPTSHASPYLQLLALVWGRVGAHGVDGQPLPDPVSLYRFLSGVGLIVACLVLASVFLWSRRQAGSRAAWLTLPTLLVLFGPAHVIWAGDLTFHGLLYAGYFSQTLAIGLLVLTLYALEARREQLGALAAPAAGLTMLVHPFTGLLLIALACAQGIGRAQQRRSNWWLAPLAIGGGFLAARWWPAYDLDAALGESGIRGTWIVAAAVVLPVAARLLPRVPLRRPSALRLGWTRRLLVPLALAGLGSVLVLAAWETWLFTHPGSDPLVHANRLSLYWVEGRWRWPLMFGAGAVGIVGLARLARRGRPLPALWFAACFAAGTAGAAGLDFPLWYRVLLFCQVPLALGVAVVLAENGRWPRRIVGATLLFTLAFKAATLVALPDRITYLGTPLQEAYRLGEFVPRGPGAVAADPFTSYYVPGATGHRVLVVTKAHVGSHRELAAAASGYRLLHEFYLGDDWWQAAQAMWQRGVRYVVVDKSVSLAPPTLAEFSTGPTPLIRTELDRRQLGTFFYRNNRVGRLVHDSDTYVVYELARDKLW